MIVNTPSYVYIAKFKRKIDDLDTFIENINYEYNRGYVNNIGYGSSVRGREIYENYKNNKELNKYMEVEMVEK